MKPPPGTPLCPLDALDDPGAKGFSFGKGQTRFDMFLVRKNGEARAWLNECPHAHARLDNWPDKFLTLDETRIICGVHAALFRIEDGFCVSGPCAGKSLTPVPVEIVDGMISIAPEDQLARNLR
ncbi:Rieske (2Fe-2S) protein [Parvibaculum sp.]|uniref:Rieske (2Fe-2S) protein n=1 Tax=Parvibaculum sp. TaxID=2024848 RepID=UPI00320E9E61